MTYLEADIDGFKQRVYAYIIKGLNYLIILGKPWMERNRVTYVAHEHRLSIGSAGNLQVWEKGWALQTEETMLVRRACHVTGSVFHAEVERIRRRAKESTDTSLSVFSVTMRDISKALEP
ncbi:hypothetical protein F5X96DRAFT_528050 [Biscogniauxia mediterranea]|nr:hypothetical protein F5X96DRAFT_528050 [Biscogniauxia mediterranea]